MKVLKTIKLPALKGFGRLLPALVLTWVFIFLLCLNSYAGDAEDLISATRKGDISTVKELLAKGADVNAKDNMFGRTALMWASENGHLELVQALLAKGADVNAKDNKGETALSLVKAKGKGHSDVAQLLIKAGANE